MNDYQLTWVCYDLLGVLIIFSLAYIMAVITEKKKKK